MKEILNELFEYHTLDKADAKNTLINLARGNYNNSQISAFLTVYLMRDLTLNELEGFREALMELRTPVSFDGLQVIDLCGTGGDGKNTFNISTTASFVVAGAGLPVAKHGNYGVSSVSGSSNLLEYLGYQFTANADNLKRSMDQANICFLHAPLFHPAMKNVAPIRKELGVKTFFNMLGPMVNPVDPEYQLVGVFSLELARAYGYLYQKLGKTFSIVHTLDGYDEISLTGKFKMINEKGEKLISPLDWGLNNTIEKSIHGGSTVKESAEIFKSILENRAKPEHKEVVIANAAAALYTAGRGASIEESIALSRHSLDSGKALQSFKKLMTTVK
jgi:anthranilate phosphoribosyltransferase